MLVAALCHFELTVLLFRNVALVTTANLRAISTIRGRITSIFAWECEACADDERVGELSVGQFDGGVPLVALQQIRPPERPGEQPSKPAPEFPQGAVMLVAGCRPGKRASGS